MECLATFHIPSKEGVVINVKFDIGEKSFSPQSLKLLAKGELQKFFQNVPISFRFTEIVVPNQITEQIEERFTE